MTSYQCPLCKQSVSQMVFEKITGIWKAKEERLEALRVKEQKLEVAAFKLQKRLFAEKKRLRAVHFEQLRDQRLRQEKKLQATLVDQQKQVKQQMAAVEKKYSQQLAKETNRILQTEKLKQRQQQEQLTNQLKQDARKEVEKARMELDRKRSTWQRDQKLQKDRHEKLLMQYKSFEAKKLVELTSAQKKIALLEDQIKKNQTPQVLGLLEEKIFLSELRRQFPQDQFVHTGKGGDIVHIVMDRKEKAGVIVYELKKVSQFSSKHILQARKAKTTRQADYALLVTNAKRSRHDSGYSITQDVIVVHPAAVIVIISIIRNNLIEISRLRLGKEERQRTIREMLAYLESPQFRNSLSDLVQDSIQLYETLCKEVKEHLRGWELRYNKYRAIYSIAQDIGAKVGKALPGRPDKRLLVTPTSFEPIALPQKIK